MSVLRTAALERGAWSLAASVVPLRSPVHQPLRPVLLLLASLCCFAPGCPQVGPLRVWPGGLCLSRSIGDKDVGDYIVPVPHVKQIRVSPLPHLATLPPCLGSHAARSSKPAWSAAADCCAPAYLTCVHSPWAAPRAGRPHHPRIRRCLGRRHQRACRQELSRAGAPAGCVPDHQGDRPNSCATPRGQPVVLCLGKVPRALHNCAAVALMNIHPGSRTAKVENSLHPFATACPGGGCDRY